MKNITLLIFGLLFSIVVWCQPAVEKMEALVAAYAQNGKFNGAVLVTKKGVPVYRSRVGYRDAEKKIGHEAGDIFQIGSLTKQITAAVILQLQEEGKLSVQDKLDRYFPGFIHGDKITIEHLLTHTSGIFNYTNDPSFMQGDLTRPFSQQQMLKMFAGYPPDFEPGEKWNYSNSGYSILGYIIEKVTGKPYERVVRERIFSPLEMLNSGFDFTHLSHPQKSKGYFSIAGNQPVPAPVVDSTISFAAGGIYSTVGDLAKWERAIASGKLLKSPSWRAVFTPYKNHYGYGWGIDTLFGKTVHAHTGGIHGFSSYILRFPQEEVAVFILDNASSNALQKMGNGLAAILLEQPYEIPGVQKEISLDPAKLKKFTGEYQFSPAFSIVITQDEDGLKAQATGQPKFAIYPEKENVFFLKVVEAKLEFVVDEAGGVSSVILHQNGMAQKAKKVK